MSRRAIAVWGSTFAAFGVASVVLSPVGSGAGLTSPSIRLRVEQVIDQFVIDLEDTTPEDTPRYNLIALADLDHDDIIDLVSVNTDTDEININFGTGSGLFEEAVTSDAVEPDDIPFSPIAIVPGDFTGPFDNEGGVPDGNLDLALVDDLGTVTVMIGDGTGEFATPDQLVDDLDTFIVSGAVAADFDGNGDQDLALADGEQVAFICNQDGTLRPCFETYVVVDDSGEAIIVDLAVGDFDGDGQPDVAALAIDRTNRLLIYPVFGDGGGDFTLGLAVGVPGDFSEISSLAVADFNNDGYDDIVAVSDADFGDNGQVFLGAANRSFRGTSPLQTVPAVALAAGNFSEDSDPDLLFSTSPRLAYIAGDGTGDFGTSPGADVIVDRGVDNRYLSDALVLKSADLNDDGLLDLVGLVRDGAQIEIALNVIQQPTQTPVTTTPTPTATVESSPTATVEPTASATVEPTPVATTGPTRSPTVRPTLPSLDSDDDGCVVVEGDRTARFPSWLVVGCAVLVLARRRRLPS